MLLRFPAWKIIVMVLTLLVGGVMALPNVMPEKYLGWLPTGAMKLGLDLRGGASILLEVNPEELRTNKLREISRDVRQALSERPAILNQRESTSDELLVTLRNPAQIEEAIERIEALGAPPVGAIGQSPTLAVERRGAGSVAVRMTADALAKLQSDALANSIEAVRRRVDNSGTVEPNIQRQGDRRIIVEVPGLDDPSQLIDVLTQSGVLTFNLVDTTANPADYQVGVPRGGRVALEDKSLGVVQVIFEDPIITGSDLATAAQAFDQYNQPNISFQLRPAGAQRFGKATTENVGKPFAIVLDNQIVSAPNIQSPITGGSGQITGNFTIEEAENLAIILRSGALPAKLEVVERRVVGAGLGQDSIDAGVTASIVGIVLVAVFMLAAYGLLGAFALVALAANLILMIGFLSGLGATLTLPGIAGILLTLGMAVDANVLVYERIREEKRNGRSPISSVEVGYSQAMSTIIDANLTTLLAALVLFQLGSGPVRGFAVTLSLGIVTSIFTAVWVARWIMAIWLKAARPKSIPI
jgi:protein-export membrane protein SecD